MADFQEHFSALRELEVEVVALSADDEENARQTVERDGLQYPVLWGLNTQDMSERIGAYIDREKGHLHATAFILRGGRVWLALYSSGALGRLQAEHVVAVVRYYRKKAQA